MHRIKKWAALGGVASLAIFLSACHKTTTQLKPPTGFFGVFYNIIGKPIQHVMEWIAGMVGNTTNGYGIAILLITLVVRLVLLPAMLNQQRKMTTSQEKAKILKPQLDIIQKQMKKPGLSQDETIHLNQLMQDVYKKNGTSMIPSMGCLTLLIQLPIFSGLYQAVAYSPEISKSTFFGIQLGHSSLIITISATILYLIQSWIMLQGVAPEQRKAMQTSALISPIMTFWFCLMYNAGLGLYFLAGGVIILIQQVIVTYVITPNIRRKMDEDLAKNPPVIVVDEHTFDQAAPAPTPTNAPINPARPGVTKRNRNAGKQQHHKK
ncbi:membrane protein insertase YidC [Lacticaseibacillus baoqingensis]|uniref:Membrane protein insertase YidC n=1 Tax=Lacticaseibacillus baoqingensis TaxID=2486013 RepID=A0ABW4E4H4_9LACO|nr:membrane protein insertase YidC [Lacticaseibacillus baoqingensis]